MEKGDGGKVGGGTRCRGGVHADSVGVQLHKEYMAQTGVHTGSATGSGRIQAHAYDGTC